MIMNSCEEKVKISDILDDDTFRISRPARSDQLEQSIRNLGMLEIPVLMKSDGGYIPFTCHNRLRIMKGAGMAEVMTNVIPAPDYGIFVKNTALKAGRGEIGPAGKAKALLIARECFGVNDLRFFSRSVLNTSGELLNPGFAEGIMALPGELVEYIDTRDIGYKIIKDILALPIWITGILAEWVSTIQVRVNIFKMLVDCLFDMRKNVNPENLPRFKPEDKTDDKKLYDTVYRMRYPRYSEMKERADSLLASVLAPGFSVDFPEFFEKDSCVIKIDIRCSDTADDIRNKLSAVDTVGLERLLALLK